MKFIRRPDLNNVTRLQIAIQAIIGMGVYGEITRLARHHHISRLFVYQLAWQVMAVFEPGINATASAEMTPAQLDRLFLLLRLEGHCSLHQISRILTELGSPFDSVGWLSERLQSFARAVPRTVYTGALLRFILCDEIFAGGRPILLTVEPQSLAILKIELAEQRTGEVWQKHFAELRKAGMIDRPRVAADQGSGLMKGCQLANLPHHPDWFHLLHPLAPFGSRYEKQAYGAIRHEYERGELHLGCTEERREKQREDYAAACAAAAKKIERADNFAWLWKELRKEMEVFDQAGQMISPEIRRERLDVILTLFREIGDPALTKELRSFAAGLEGYWSYYERMWEMWVGFQEKYPAGALSFLALSWQADRQARNSREYSRQKGLRGESELFAEEARRLAGATGAQMWEEVWTALEEEVRSSSLVENVNSTLRPLLETCRGQVKQELLELFAFVHNHRPFERGKRRGQAPMEILTGKPLTKSWLEMLLENG